MIPVAEIPCDISSGVKKPLMNDHARFWCTQVWMASVAECLAARMTYFLPCSSRDATEADVEEEC